MVPAAVGAAEPLPVREHLLAALDKVQRVIMFIKIIGWAPHF